VDVEVDYASSSDFKLDFKLEFKLDFELWFEPDLSSGDPDRDLLKW